MTGAPHLPPGLGYRARPDDPFPGYLREILDVLASIEASESDEEADPLMDRWAEIDRLAKTTRPSTLAGAIASLEYARRELVQFEMNDDESCDDPTASLLLALLDGALGVLRTIVCGKGGPDA